MTVGVICIDNMPGGERSSARGTVLEIGVAEFFFPKKMEKLLLWFNNHGNFVCRPGEWEASEPASAGGGGKDRTPWQSLALAWKAARSFLRHGLHIKNDADPHDVFTQVHILDPVKNGEINLVGKEQVVQFFVNQAQFQ